MTHKALKIYTAFICAVLLLNIGQAFAQKAPSKAGSTTMPKDSIKEKSLATAVATAKPVSPKPFKDVIPATAKTMHGFFKVHLVADKYFLEIPDTLLKRDILIVNRQDQAPAGFRLPFGLSSFAGDQMGESVIQIEKIPGEKLAIKSILFKERALDTTENGLGKLLVKSNVQSIQGTFAIKAFNFERHSSIIEVTDFINGDNAIFSINDPLPKSFLGSLIADRSFIEDIKAFPDNIEIKTVKTFNLKPTGQIPGKPVTFQLNSSVILLPKNPMRPRVADPRVGFFSNVYDDFDANMYGVSTKAFIWRWRLEPKPADLDRYRKGELVEPQKPIVIYIDPLTPKKWVPYLKQGIEDWQVAFEKAGFKNAIIAKDAPLNDSTWSIDDARHSVLVYKPSAVFNAMGPSIKDPRSGEILETHINWHHSVMTLLQSWYTIQAGAIDPRVRRPDLDEHLMGELVRFVSSHEVGHTLGLMHNFGASSTVPVANLRNKAWVEAHGHTPSIMDYARFNYVAQPEDQISEKGIYPRIGDYDKWAIEWGYKYFPDISNATEEHKILNDLVVDKLKSGKQYFYGSQVDPLTNDLSYSQNFDPRDQTEDLGDDAMLAGSYGIKNLKRIKPHLVEWMRKPAENYDRASLMYKELISQFQRYMGHVLKNIGGIYTTPVTADQPGPAFTVVPKAIQKRAMQFLNEQLFKTPDWLIDGKLYSVSKCDFSMVTKVQEQILAVLLNPQRLSLLNSEEKNFPGQAYTVDALLTDLGNGIFAEIPARKSITVYRRDLQKAYVQLLTLYVSKNTGDDTDVSSLLKAHLKKLASVTKTAIGRSPDRMTKYHLADIAGRLENALKPSGK
ncbi:zinc-dependent metalloprotease [Mucilaginibacter terrae]|uniref:DUF5117 domain-containing protein n=1 Tax=Mucilaginibacter terrae TaxID=1955052 RepID=A0ABU3GSA0_9SPHI|nr:zinc-dependent metalloprotease [Mucilaginibacter terrae]MDT3402351.1 hypothetical protein [Mucilaginibacter terrae]